MHLVTFSRLILGFIKQNVCNYTAVRVVEFSAVLNSEPWYITALANCLFSDSRLRKTCDINSLAGITKHNAAFLAMSL